MRLAVLTAADSWYFGDLRRAAADRHELSAVSFRALNSTIGVALGKSSLGNVGQAANELELVHETQGQHPVVAQVTGSRLDDFDAVLVRTMPPGSLEQVVFRMDSLNQLEKAGTPVVNPARAIECAVDKYLTTARLAAAGLPVPRTVACQSVEDGLRAFTDLGGDVVLKPLFGSEGRGITRLRDHELAERAFRLLVPLGAVLYLQEFVPHGGYDLRLLLIGRQVLAMRRFNALDWRTNMSRGATAEPVEPCVEWVELARRAADVVGAPIAGIDLLPARDGRTLVLEVNAVPGWRALAATHGKDIAAMVLGYVETLVESGV